MVYKTVIRNLENRSQLNPMISIKPFKSEYQKEIDHMLEHISGEFETSIFNNEKPSKALSYNQYWVAFHKEELIGTIAILNIEKGCSVLKNMFVKKEFRGKAFNVGGKLLQNVFTWCSNENIHSVYLGTMKQFIAAQKFYEKNGFQKIGKSELPESFIQNPIDSIFYKAHV